MSRRTLAAVRALVLPSVLVVAVAAALVGCSASKSATPAETQSMGEAAPAGAPAPARGSGSGDRQAVAAPGFSVAAPSGLEAMSATRKLIRTGRLSIEVASYASAAEQAVRLTEAAQGYLADSQSRRSEHGKLSGRLTLRVPAGQFAALFERLKALGTVQSESVETQDVTRAYTDLETRLRVKRDTAARLREILNTRTAKLSEVLEAERELARVTEEIETLEGERRFYDQQIALSTITAELAEPEPMVRSGFLDPIKSALSGSLELLGGSIAALIAVTVVALPWLLALLFLFWVVRGLRRRRRAAAKP